MLHDARPGEAPASTASAAQDPEHQSPREPSAQAAGTGASHTPGPTFTWDGVRSPHSGWGSCTPGCVPQGPPTSNHHTPFLLFFAERLPHTRTPSSSWNTPLGAVTPRGAFLPPFEGAPCLSLPRSPLASRQPHAQLVMDGQAGRLGAPALAPGPLASPPHLPALRSPAQLQELSCPHGSSTGQRFSCGMRGAQPSRRRPCFCR